MCNSLLLTSLDVIPYASAGINITKEVAFDVISNIQNILSFLLLKIPNSGDIAKLNQRQHITPELKSIIRGHYNKYFNSLP